ncbi:HTH_38 domain-containing protein [Trichonephila clavipes]|nr:HTH_38 domain-containing protein [Trichonephila clavipes]
MNNLSGNKKRKNDRVMPAVHNNLSSTSSDEKAILMKDRCILASNGYSVGRKIDSGTFATVREAGWSNRRIGRHLGRSDMVVARCWQQWITEGRVYRRGGSGRPRNTNDREDRAIRRVATSAPTTSLASIQRHLPPSRHPVPSRENHKETTDRSWLEEPTSAKTLTTDPTS